MIDLRLANCVDEMSRMADKSVKLVVTDPPYGCGKAEWDDNFPTLWYREARRIAEIVVIITGSSGLADSIPLVGEDFIDVIAAWNKNGMTRSPLGFGNWLSAVVAVGKPRRGQNFFEFTVRGDMPNHPTPKPIEYMEKLIERVSEKGDTIVDPFMGSGTTGVACVKLGRNFIGYEINPDYYSDTELRINNALADVGKADKILAPNITVSPMFA